MDKLKELLTADPCYEQHIVSIKNLYEEHLFSILISAIFDGFKYTYKRSYEIEQRLINASKKNSNITTYGVLTIFQKFIKDIPNLSIHKIREESNRIKTATKTADIFDDLVKAVCKANIILLTYNVDHKRHELLYTNYHENIIIHDFIHNCYIQSAKEFYSRSELFYHINEAHIINQNKKICFKIIHTAINDAIRLMLPMKEILLEYTKQPYMQKTKQVIHETEQINTELSEVSETNKEDLTLLLSNNEINNVVSEYKENIVENKENIMADEKIIAENNMKLVNIEGGKGTKTFFNEISPEIKKRVDEYNSNNKRNHIATEQNIVNDLLTI